MSEERAPYMVVEREQALACPPRGTWLRHKSGVEGPFVGHVRIGDGPPQWCVLARWPDAMVTHYAAPPASWQRVLACPVCGAPLHVRTGDEELGGDARGGCTCFYWCAHCQEARDP